MPITIKPSQKKFFMPLLRLPDPIQVIHYLKHVFTAKRRGHGVHSPFAYSLCEEVFYNQKPFYEFDELDRLRSRLFKNQTELQIQDLGAGSKYLTSTQRKVCDIAKQGISSSKQSKVLFRLINYFSCATSIELGSSLGLNSLFMARGNSSGQVYSIEGSESLHAFAKELAAKYKANNIHFLKGNFDEQLPELLNTIPHFDLAYVDGNHNQEATLRYFYLLMEKSEEHSVLVFDDIHWSKGMALAWEEIKRHPKVKLSIDTYYTGFVFFKEEIKEKQNLCFLL